MLDYRGAAEAPVWSLLRRGRFSANKIFRASDYNEGICQEGGCLVGWTAYTAGQVSAARGVGTLLNFGALSVSYAGYDLYNKWQSCLEGKDLMSTSEAWITIFWNDGPVAY
jgi:hypothetical protein